MLLDGSTRVVAVQFVTSYGADIHRVEVTECYRTTGRFPAPLAAQAEITVMENVSRKVFAAAQILRIHELGSEGSA